MTEQKISRRQVVGGAAVAGVGLPLLAACGSGQAIGSDGANSQPSGPQTLGNASEVAVGGGKIYPDANVVVTQPAAGSYQGFIATCTHQGCQVASVSGGTINCPCHGSQFSIKDGSVVAGPATQPLAAAKVTVQGSDLIAQG